MAIDLGTSCDECDHYIAADEMRVCKACYEGALEAAHINQRLLGAARQRIKELKAELTQARVVLVGEKMKGGHSWRSTRRRLPRSKHY